MCKRMSLIVIVSATLSGGTPLGFAQEKAPSPARGQIQQPNRYEAEEGVPKGEVAEKRRDNSVLEAALNDLASPRNPEYKYHIRNVGPGREILVGHRMWTKSAVFELQEESRNIDGTDPRVIPAALRKDFGRRSGMPAGSLKDF